MTGHAQIRQLLEHALAEPPAVADDRPLFARAARIRRRRRTGLGLAAAGLLAVGAIVPGWGPPDRPSAAERPERQQAQRLQALLPAGLGTVERAAPVLGPGADHAGPLDGVYWLRRDGRLGVIRIETGLASSPSLSCTPELPAVAARSCTLQAALRRDELTVDQRPDPEGRVELAWGRSVDAVLLLPGGRALFVDAISGYRGARAPGPAMDAPPLTAEQLRDLVRRPELTAVGDGGL
ncbi:hypothetical protein TR51_26320 [Kitasatospora griseola]|uniref:Uncharacterized protein n=1 Tax=Kitasatospora griseola TaxID=2064 RepID=A0A0D0PJ42_KITGR|nr:hypothetical protein [Kitasatospora griseola]KIQ62529.1 hypothetical protein TR51_26320 [Kitasatospora griseola]